MTSHENTNAEADTADALPEFHDAAHVRYVTTLAERLDAPTSYEGAVTSHLKMAGVYWSVGAMSLLRSRKEVNESMRLESEIVDFVFACFDERAGGFGANVGGHDAHLTYTLYALQILAMAGRLDDERLDAERVVTFVASLQRADDGSFAGDEWGEIDTRFSYCAVSALSLLGRLREGRSDAIDVDAAAAYVASCRNFDGGFGCVPGAESHAGQVFCCVGALAICQRLDLLDAPLLSFWLCERQCDSGGLNGRPEKQADVCYSWWILSALRILGRTDWIDGDRLRNFVLRCQDPDDGGIADRPEDMPDVFHTFFGIAGLSLLGHLESFEKDGRKYRAVDPLYALPTDVVEELGLDGQVLGWKDQSEEDRTLGSYETLMLNDKQQHYGMDESPRTS